MTSRVRLVFLADAEALAELQRRNRAFLAPWEPERPDEFFTAGGQRARVEAALDRHERGEALPLVVLDDDGKVAGRVTLSGIVRGAFLSCSIGYWLSEDRSGRGLATQAVEAAASIAFGELGLHRIQAESLADNARSQRVLERTGFVRYGLAPRYLRIAGDWRDHVLYQRLSE